MCNLPDTWRTECCFSKASSTCYDYLNLPLHVWESSGKGGSYSSSRHLMCYVKLINMSGELLSAQIFVTLPEKLCKCVKQFAASSHHLLFSEDQRWQRWSGWVRFPSLLLTLLSSTVSLCSSSWSWSLRCWLLRPSSPSTSPWRMMSCCLSTHRPWPPRPRRAPCQQPKVENLLMICTVHKTAICII